MPERGARFGGHPLHPVLVTLPIGLCTFSVVADAARWLGGGSVWRELAFYTLGAGLVGALLAAVPGVIDFLTITNRQARDIAVAHMATMLVAVGILAFSFWLRWIGTLGAVPVGVSVLGLTLLGIGGWLGGELVFVHGQGMTPEARQESSSVDQTGRPRRWGA